MTTDKFCINCAYHRLWPNEYTHDCQYLVRVTDPEPVAGQTFKIRGGECSLFRLPPIDDKEVKCGPEGKFFVEQKAEPPITPEVFQENQQNWIEKSFEKARARYIAPFKW